MSGNDAEKSRNGIVLSSRVRLARNLKDLFFRPKMTAEMADECIDRVLNVLKAEPDEYRYYPMRGIDAVQREALVEEHRISPDLFRQDDRGAALISSGGQVVIMVNEEDHLRIQAFAEGLALEDAAERAFQVEDSLQRQLVFAFDDQLGYLTACPTNTGTGMRASVMLHLPMLTAKKQMGQVTQLAAKLGLTMRGMYGEGSEALGSVYQLSNQVTLGKTEHELVEAVTAVAGQIAGMEQVLREKAVREEAVEFEDRIMRAEGILLYARLVDMKEFYPLWSSLRLGAAMNRVKVSVGQCDRILREAHRAHLIRAAGKELTEAELRRARADMIRRELEAVK